MCQFYIFSFCHLQTSHILYCMFGGGKGQWHLVNSRGSQTSAGSGEVNTLPATLNENSSQIFGYSFNPMLWVNITILQIVRTFISMAAFTPTSSQCKLIKKIVCRLQELTATLLEEYTVCPLTLMTGPSTCKPMPSFPTMIIKVLSYLRALLLMYSLKL